MSTGKKRWIETGICLAVVILVFIILGLCGGLKNYSEWWDTPFIQREPDCIEVKVVRHPSEGSIIPVDIYIYNTSKKEVTSYEFTVYVGPCEVKINSSQMIGTGAIPANGSVQVYALLRGDMNDPEYIAFYNHPEREPRIEMKTSKMKGGSGTINNTSSSQKVILFVILFVVGNLAFFFLNRIENTPLRIVLKLLFAPMAFILGIVLLIAFVAQGGLGAAGSLGYDSTKERLRKRNFERAQQDYERAAKFHAGYKAQGAAEGAAREQRHMDIAMARMIKYSQGSESQSRMSKASFDAAQQDYERAAKFHAGYKARGAAEDAARERKNMDIAMAKMMKHKGK